MIVEPTAGGNDYQLKPKTGGGTEWDNSGTDYYLSSELPCPEATFENPKEVQLEVPAIPAAGNIYIKFFAPVDTTTSTYFFVSSVELQIVPALINDFPATAVETTEINTDNNERLSVSVMLADSPEVENSDPVYRGVLKENKTDTYTDSWKKDGAGTGRTLVEWMQQWSNAETAAYRWRGLIKGQADYFNVVQFTQINDEVFAWEDVEYFIKSAEWGGSAIQIKGVLLHGSTETAEAGSGRSVSGGGGGGIINPATGDYRAGTESLSSGNQTVSFSEIFTTNYQLFIHVENASNELIGYTLSNEDENGFDIDVDEACTLKYIALKNK
nr:hypothetical protein 19 [bacterium]